MMKTGILCLFILILIFAQGCNHILGSDRHNISDDSLSRDANLRETRFRGETIPEKALIARSKIDTISAMYQNKAKGQTLQKSIKEIVLVSMFFWPELFVDLTVGQEYENRPIESDFNFNQ